MIPVNPLKHFLATNPLTSKMPLSTQTILEAVIQKKTSPAKISELCLNLASDTPFKGAFWRRAKHNRWPLIALSALNSGQISEAQATTIFMIWAACREFVWGSKTYTGKQYGTEIDAAPFKVIYPSNTGKIYSVLLGLCFKVDQEDLEDLYEEIELLPKADQAIFIFRMPNPSHKHGSALLYQISNTRDKTHHPFPLYFTKSDQKSKGCFSAFMIQQIWARFNTDFQLKIDLILGLKQAPVPTFINDLEAGPFSNIAFQIFQLTEYKKLSWHHLIASRRIKQLLRKENLSHDLEKYLNRFDTFYVRFFSNPSLLFKDFLEDPALEEIWGAYNAKYKKYITDDTANHSKLWNLLFPNDGFKTNKLRTTRSFITSFQNRQEVPEFICTSNFGTLKIFEPLPDKTTADSISFDLKEVRLQTSSFQSTQDIELEELFETPRDFISYYLGDDPIEQFITSFTFTIRKNPKEAFERLKDFQILINPFWGAYKFTGEELGKILTLPKKDWGLFLLICCKQENLTKKQMLLLHKILSSITEHQIDQDISDFFNALKDKFSSEISEKSIQNLYLLKSLIIKKMLDPLTVFNNHVLEKCLLLLKPIDSGFLEISEVLSLSLELIKRIKTIRITKKTTLFADSSQKIACVYQENHCHLVGDWTNFSVCKRDLLLTALPQIKSLENKKRFLEIIVQTEVPFNGKTLRLMKMFTQPISKGFLKIEEVVLFKESLASIVQEIKDHINRPIEIYDCSNSDEPYCNVLFLDETTGILCAHYKDCYHFFGDLSTEHSDFLSELFNSSSDLLFPSYSNEDEKEDATDLIMLLFLQVSETPRDRINKLNKVELLRPFVDFSKKS